MAAAVKLYELGRLSSGAAATLAGIPRTLFLMKLADYGVSSFQLSEEELRRTSGVPEVIADTSALQYLHQANHLDLLRRLDGTIAVPEGDDKLARRMARHLGIRFTGRLDDGYQSRERGGAHGASPSRSRGR